jgi:hypothetical protein
MGGMSLSLLSISQRLIPLRKCSSADLEMVSLAYTFHNLSLGLESDEENKSSAQLLQLHNKPDTLLSMLFLQNNNLKGEGCAGAVGVTLADVWDG